MIQEDALIRKFLGIPFKHRGRDIEGFDCYGLFKAVYAEQGFKIYDVDEDYEKDWVLTGSNLFIENLWRDWEKVADSPRYCDGILFKGIMGVASHAGVYLSEGRFIHCCRQGVIVSRLSSEPFKSSIVGIYRLKAMQ